MPPTTLPQAPTIASFETEATLSGVVANARSAAEVQFAITGLKGIIGEREILRLANLREAFLDIPDPPFGTGGEIAILERVADYERTGRSYRREFISGSGFFGLEFCGDGNRVDAIVVHAPGVRVALSDHEPEEIVPAAILDLVLKHDTFFAHLVEALQTLGVSFGPRFHMGLDEFMLEHAVQSLEEINSIF